jgi:large subunit ribosomal protein L6
MSRVGKNPISIPSGTQVTLNGNKIQVKGSLGVLSRDLSDQR